MFYYLEGLEHRVQLHPKNLGKKDVSWDKMIGYKASLELAESFDPDLGYIVDLCCINKIGEGIIQFQTGLIEHRVSYNAVVQFPLQGEVIDAVVHKVKKNSVIFCFIGVIYGIVNTDHFPIDVDYDYKEEVEMVDEADGKSELKLVSKFVCVDRQKREKDIEKGNVIRLRIIERAFGNSGFWLTGSMKNKFLGVRVTPKKADGSSGGESDIGSASGSTTQVAEGGQQEEELSADVEAVTISEKETADTSLDFKDL